MKWRSLLIAMLLVCTWLTHSSAEGLMMPWSGQANGNLILRSSPPSGPFYLKGDKIGIVKKGEQFKVLEWKFIDTLFETQEWLRIERESKTGWVYNGKLKGVDDIIIRYVEPIEPESM